MKAKSIRTLLFFISRPIFFNFFYYLSKICLYAMNRTSAAFLKPEYSGEKEALEWILKRLNHRKSLTIFDCGGNIGDYAEMIVSVSDRFDANVELHIFEPSQSCFDSLTKKFNRSTNIHIHKLAISDAEGVADLYYPWVGSAGASLSSDVSVAQRTESYQTQSERVNLMTIDSFCKDNNITNIAYLKLDIEGYETCALRGACQMLVDKKISYIQLELGAASLVTKSMLFDVWNMLAATYNFYLVLNHGVVEIDEYKPDLECFHGASNFILELR